MYIVCDPPKSLNWVDSNTRGRPCLIYRLVLPLQSREILSSLSKFSLFNAHLAVFVQRMTELQLHTTVVELEVRFQGFNLTTFQVRPHPFVVACTSAHHRTQIIFTTSL